jgi:hypothetical protein
VAENVDEELVVPSAYHNMPKIIDDEGADDDRRDVKSVVVISA